MQESESKPTSDWQKTPYANLIRYVPSGKLYARLRVKGKLIIRSLKTDVISVAKLRLADLEKEERKAAEALDTLESGKMTFGDALEVFRQRIEGDPSLKRNSKIYYQERITALLRSWPELSATPVRRITKNDCLTWAMHFRAKASPTAFNNTALVLRKVIDLGVELGARYDNPAKSIKRERPKPKDLTLPSQEMFDRWVSAIDSQGVCQCRNSANLVRFLAYGGMRLGEAENVTWVDCDFTRGMIIVRGDPEQGTKGGETRIVPMIEEMRLLLERLRAERPDEPTTSRVMRVSECQGNMTRAAKAVGMKRITHHDLRHLFATRCIESGVDIPTVSRWLGHKDGGALAMKTYGHLRDEHSAEMARRVSFGKKEVV